MIALHFRSIVLAQLSLCVLSASVRRRAESTPCSGSSTRVIDRAVST